MDVAEAIKQRRSIKYFDPDHAMSAEEQQKLLSLAMLSPSAFNLQHWRFVVVEDKALRLKLREAAWDQPQVSDASMLIILCADIKAWEKEPRRYWHSASTEVQDIMLPYIEGSYAGNEQEQRDEAMRSSGIVAQTLMLAAKGMGYDTCPMVGFDKRKVAQLIHLPDDHLLTMFITVGKAVKPANPRPGLLPLDELVIKDHF